MWGSPEKNEQKEQKCGPRHLISDCRPAHEHGNGPGGTANDDVLAARALQPYGINDHVEHGGREGEEGRQEVGADPQNGESHNFQNPGKNDGISRGDEAGDQGPPLGALHEFVDIAVDDHVEGVRPASGQ